MSPVNQPLVVVLGPTGSGKSELALRLANRFSGEIVGCDSLQVYRLFDIGTAKVPFEARRGIPHHLIDILDADHVFTAGEYVRRAGAALVDIAARGRLPVIVGGTGFYLRALLDGLSPGPVRDEELRARLLERSIKRPASLHRILLRLDRPSSLRIHANDINKLIRALEICILARRPMSALFPGDRAGLRGFTVLKLGLDPPRERLFERLDARCRWMMESGLIEEVRSILGRGVSPLAKPFESLGYKQALLLLRGELDADEALRQMQRDTRHYAKRQLTWFRREPNVSWLNGFGGDAAVSRIAEDTVSKIFFRN